MEPTLKDVLEEIRALRHTIIAQAEVREADVRRAVEWERRMDATSREVDQSLDALNRLAESL